MDLSFSNTTALNNSGGREIFEALAFQIFFIFLVYVDVKIEDVLSSIFKIYCDKNDSDVILGVW